MDLPIELDAESGVPLHRQLYERLRSAIVEGRIVPGTRLPSSRALADSLGISRSTVTSTFAELHSEGYLAATTGSGTFVSLVLPDHIAVPKTRQRGDDTNCTSIRLSSYGALLAEARSLEPARVEGTIDFRDGRPAFDAFPFEEWRRCIAGAAQREGSWLDYRSDPAGHPPLRTAIATYLGRARGILCQADDIIIVNGSQQAIDIVARVLIEPGDVVALEEPGYLGAQRSFAAHGADVRPIRVDDDGIRVEALPLEAAGARLVYVTPSHQFPLGVVLSSERRRRLLQWAADVDAVVVEDDYDSAYRYEGRPIPALYGMDTHGRVVYVGTFSKTMFPALRIGYIVVPPTLRQIMRTAKAFADRQSPMLEQRALTSFMNEGGYERHLRRMHVLYSSRRSALLASLRRHIGDEIVVLGERAGMHLVARLPVIDSTSFADRALRVGVVLMSTHAHHLRESVPGEFIFGFAELDERTADEGIARLGRLLRDA